MKQNITKLLGTIDCSVLDGLNLEQVIEVFSRIMQPNSKLDYDYDGTFYVKSTREETNDEYNRRIISENAAKEKLKQKELETLRKLKEKYEI